MKIIIKIISILILTSCGSSAPKLDDAIVKIDFSSREHPGFYCSGVVIGEHEILTAAHCFTEFSGTPDFVTLQNGSRHLVEAWDLHSEFKEKPVDDLAIIRVSNIRELTNAPEISFTSDIEVGDVVTQRGWGSKRYDGYTVWHEYTVRELKVTRVTPTHFVTTGNIDGGPCYGDSGGGIFAGSRVVGITSRVTNGCNTEYSEHVVTFASLDF